MFDNKIGTDGNLRCRKCGELVSECICEKASPFDLLSKHVSRTARDRILDEASEEAEDETEDSGNHEETTEE